MSTASRPFNALPSPVKRLVYASLAVALFFGASAVVHPERSMADVEAYSAMNRSRAQLATEADRLATPARPASDAGSTTAPLTPPASMTGRPLMGTLTGSPYYIWVYAGPTGPLYTVADKSGRTLCIELDADALYQQLPDVSVQTLQLERGATGPVMIVDPALQR